MPQRHTLYRCLAAALALSLCAVAPAQQTMSERQVTSLWRHNWPLFAARYVKVNDQYRPCAKYNFDYPSSRLEKPEKYTDQHQRTRTIRTSPVGVGMTRKSTTKLPRDDAEAFVRAIPRLEVGEYGYIHSAKVAKIIDDDEMYVVDIRLINTDALLESKRDTARDLARRNRSATQRAIEAEVEWRYQKRDEIVELQENKAFQRALHLVGYDTKDLKVDDIWSGQTPHEQTGGVQLAIVDEEVYSRTRLIPIAVSAWHLRQRDMTEDQFRAMLAARGFDETTFVELVLNTKRDDPENADVAIMNALEAERIAKETEARKEADANSRRSRRKRD